MFKRDSRRKLGTEGPGGPQQNEALGGFLSSQLPHCPGDSISSPLGLRVVMIGPHLSSHSVSTFWVLVLLREAGL